jgi:hypothetical protein
MNSKEGYAGFMIKADFPHILAAAVNKFLTKGYFSKKNKKIENRGYSPTVNAQNVSVPPIAPAGETGESPSVNQYNQFKDRPNRNFSFESFHCYTELCAIIWAFKNAKRTGSVKDVPEGTRTISISDTFAKQLIVALEKIRKMINEYEKKYTGDGFTNE